MAVIPDQPELLALATLASVSATKIATAFSDPVNLFDHLTLEELDRVRNACERLGALSLQMVEATAIYTEAAKEALASIKES